MTRGCLLACVRRPRLRRCAAGLTVLAAVVGCGKAPREQLSYSLATPQGWQPISGASVPLLPGEVLEAYEVPAPSARGSLVILRSGYLPRTQPKELLAQTRYLFLNLPEMKIQSEELVEVGGEAGIRFEVTGQGTGRNLSPTGLGKPIPPAGEKQLPTRRVWIRVPRGVEQGTLEIFYHVPEADRAALAPAFDEVLRSLRIRPS